MQNNGDRAVQFKAFDALKGFNEALKEVEQQYEWKNVFSSLDKKLNNLYKGDRVIIKYYNNLDYLEIRGVVRDVKD